MDYGKWLLFCCGWSCVVTTASGESPRITSENASQVRLSAETPKQANRILLGPGPEELTVLGYSTPLEIVDNREFRTLRRIKEDFVPIDFVWSPDRRFITWTEQNSKSFFLLEVQSGKITEIDIDDYPGNVAFSPNSKQLAIGKTFWDPNAQGKGLSEVVLVDVTGKVIRIIEVGQPGGLLVHLSKAMTQEDRQIRTYGIPVSQ